LDWKILQKGQVEVPIVCFETLSPHQWLGKGSGYARLGVQLAREKKETAELCML